MNFKQAMVVPTLVSFGFAALLTARNLSLMEVSYAAPAAAESQGAPASAKAPPAAEKSAAQVMVLPSKEGTGAEFESMEKHTVIKAISPSELARKAVETSGREDPFMALVPPDPGAIRFPTLALPTPRALPPLAGLPFLPDAPVSAPKPTPRPIVAPIAAPVVSLTGGTGQPRPSAAPVMPEVPWAGDQPPAASEPQWIVRGIISTGVERLALLEGKNNQMQARVGDDLPDGSRVAAISPRGVTFLRSGRRFVKHIGGTD